MKALLFLILACLCLNTSAQRRKKAEPEFPITAQEAIAKYDFKMAEEILNAKIDYRISNNDSTSDLDSLLEIAIKGRIRLQATERVTIIDSLILPKSQLLANLPLGQEGGSLQSYAKCFGKPDTLDCTVFENQLSNQRVFAMPYRQGETRLFGQELIGNGWTEPKELQVLEVQEGDKVNYPFMLSDGITLYFAAETEESLGGYDIYMTRYDSDDRTFLAPENIGMPFNSPANDYLYAIDEFNNLGWFATDRNMPADSVCLYTFIPNTTRRVYNENEVTTDSLMGLARISSIKDTWENPTAVKEALARKKALEKTEKAEAKPHDFDFVINDLYTYTTYSDFKNAQAQLRIKFWVESKNELQTAQQQLQALRNKYGSQSKEGKTQLAPQIRILEGKVEQLIQDIRQEEKQIRKLELNK